MDRRAALGVLLPAIVLTARTAFADGAMGVDEAVGLALEGNRGVARAKSALDAAERNLGTSWNGLLPGITFGTGVAGSATGSTSVNGSASVGLTVSAAVLSSMELAGAQRDATELALRVALRDVELSVRKAYLSLALASENVKVLERSVETAKASSDQVESRRKAGLASELDSLTALVALEKLKPTLASAKLSYDNQLEAFKLLLGLRLDDPVTIGDASAALAVPELRPILSSTVEKAALESPAVSTLNAALETAKAKLSAAERLVWTPALALSWSFKPTWTEGVYRDAGSISATASISADSFLPWSAERQATIAAREAMELAEDKVAEAKDEAVRSARALARKIEQSMASVEALRLGVSLAERSLSLTEEAYRFGTKDLLAVQNASDSLRSARLQLLSESYTLVGATLDLEYALGAPFGTLRGNR